MYPEFFYISLLKKALENPTKGLHPSKYRGEDYLSWLVEKSNEGYFEARSELLNILTEQTKNANFASVAIKAFLVSALSNIAEGESANKEFFQSNSGRGNRNKKFSDIEDDKAVAYQVLEKRELAHLFGMAPLTLEECYKQVGNDFCTSPDNVKKKYLKYKDLLMNEYTSILGKDLVIKKQ